MMAEEGSVITQVVSICKDEIDSGYISTVDELESMLVDETKHIAIAVRDEDSDSLFTVSRLDASMVNSDVEVLGFMICGTYEYDEYDEYTDGRAKMILNDTDALSQSDFPVFLFQAFAVRSEYHGNGIGSELVSYCISSFAHFPWLAAIWDRPDNRRNKTIVEKYGTQITTINDYYPDDWDCPACESSCSCSSTFYVYSP